MSITESDHYPKIVLAGIFALAAFSGIALVILLKLGIFATRCIRMRWNQRQHEYGYQSLNMFAETILLTAEAFIVNLNGVEDMVQDQAVDPGPASGASFGTGLPLASESHSGASPLSDSNQALPVDFGARKFDENLATARIMEELDAISNAKKEDRVMISGLTDSTVSFPVAFEDRKKWLEDKVKELISRIDLESASKIIFIWLNASRDSIPIVEVRFHSKDTAVMIRQEFAAKKKVGEHFGRIHLTNCVNLATRVRVDILRAIAKQFGSDKPQEMYVYAYSSRPVLHIRQNKGHWIALTFSDAISRFGLKLNDDGLGEAYRRAGSAFKGQLQKHFVVLRDNVLPAAAANRHAQLCGK